MSLLAFWDTQKNGKHFKLWVVLLVFLREVPEVLLEEAQGVQLEVVQGVQLEVVQGVQMLVLQVVVLQQLQGQDQGQQAINYQASLLNTESQE